MNVVFVCTGNLCRSPMAEGLMKHALVDRGCNGIKVTSVGTWAYDGNPAMPEAIELLSQRGIDLANHRSRPVDPDELEAADVVIVMTSVHVRELKTMHPDVMDKVLMLKELTEIEPNPEAGNGTPEQRLRGLLTGTKPASRRSLDVDDPIGLPIGAYERCADDLQRGIDVLVKAICP